MLNVCWKRQVIPSKETELMSSDWEEFNVGDSVLIVGTDLEESWELLSQLPPGPKAAVTSSFLRMAVGAYSTRRTCPTVDDYRLARAGWILTSPSPHQPTHLVQGSTIS